MLLDSTNPATNPITAPLHAPRNPDARVDLPNLTCEPLAGLPELAVLYAAGQAQATRRGLEDLCAKARPDRRAWEMLFDLHRVLGERDAFDALRPVYRKRFADGAEPMWQAPTAAPGSHCVAFSGVLDGQERFPEFVEEARARGIVMLDLEHVTRIDFSFAPRFCAALRLMALRQKRVIVANAGELHAQLLQAVGLHPGVALIPRCPGALAPIGIDPSALAA